MLAPTLEELGYELEKTAKERDELVQALEEAIAIQKDNYGSGMMTHLALISWAPKARAALAKVKGDGT